MRSPRSCSAPEHKLIVQRMPYETGGARYRETARGQILGQHYFLRTVFDYLTLPELYKVAALDASNELRF